MLSWNTTLFLLLNAASKPNPALQGLVVAVAGIPVLLAPVPERVNDIDTAGFGI